MIAKKSAFIKSKMTSLRLSTGSEFQVQAKKADVTCYSITRIGHQLIVRQPVDVNENDERLIQALIQRFLMKDQQRALSERLRALSEGWIEERFSRVRLRDAMTRWGSCNKKTGVIMLSVKLLFMDPKLLDYVCVHELAHLKYADHSDLFWDLVSRKMPDWKVQRKRLRLLEREGTTEKYLFESF